MKTEIKITEEGYIIDLFNKKGELQTSKTLWKKDLEEEFRQYLKDMANDENAEVETIEDWHTWLEEEIILQKERINEVI